MSVTYYSVIATAGYFKVFRLLFTWKGSIYKAVGIELIVFCLLYGFISVTHHFILEGDKKAYFQKFCVYCASNLASIPLELVLGFYVSLVVARWNQQFMTIPWPDSLSLYISTFIQGLSDIPRQIRRNMMRYICVSQIMCFSTISSKARKVFPDLNSLQEKMVLTEEEILSLSQTKSTFNKYFVPICWAQNLLNKAQKEGYLVDNKRVMHLINEFNEFRNKLGGLLAFDWINPPLIYTQIAIIVLYGYFILAIFGKQFLDPLVTKTDYFLTIFPIFDILEFIYRIGWLKVAQCLINPFGDDEDDFEIDKILSRNLEFSMIMVDNWHQEIPELKKDAYWYEVSNRLIDANESYITGSLDKKNRIVL